MQYDPTLVLQFNMIVVIGGPPVGQLVAIATPEKNFSMEKVLKFVHGQSKYYSLLQSKVLLPHLKLLGWSTTDRSMIQMDLLINKDDFYFEFNPMYHFLIKDFLFVFPSNN